MTSRSTYAVVAQPGCHTLMRHELQQRGVPVPAADPPAGLQLAQVTAFIAAADAGGLERLAGVVGAARPTQR